LLISAVQHTGSFLANFSALATELSYKLLVHATHVNFSIISVLHLIISYLRVVEESSEIVGTSPST